MRHLLSSLSVAALMAAKWPKESSIVAVSALTDGPLPEPDPFEPAVKVTIADVYPITACTDYLSISARKVHIDFRRKNRGPFYMSVPKRKRGRKRHQ